MRISFVYRNTKRTGILLGMHTGREGQLLLSVREDGADSPVKTFLAVSAQDVSTVLEPHEQVPGVFTAETAAMPGVFAAYAPINNQVIKRLADLENRFDQLDGKLDDVRIALTD